MNIGLDAGTTTDGELRPGLGSPRPAKRTTDDARKSTLRWLAATSTLLVLSAACGSPDASNTPPPVPPDTAATIDVVNGSTQSPDAGVAGGADIGATVDANPGANVDADVDAGTIDAAWTAGDTRVERSVTGVAVLRDLRVARHDGFDRIVMDFGTDAVPGYRIAYIDRPVRQCGSGNVVALAGDAWLSISVEPAHAHTDAGEPTVQERERAPRLPTVLELKMTCDFEAITEVVAGVTSPERYRTFTLESPMRLVIDIRHPGT